MKKQFWVISLIFVAILSLSHKGFGEEKGDPYLWLEDVEGAKALEWVAEQNEKSVARLESDKRFGEFRSFVQSILEDKEKIPYGSRRGNYIYNFWQDDKHVRGIWRRTKIANYDFPSPKWETVLDIDRLAKKEKENWVFKGPTCLPPDFQRCLVNLSRGGKDAVVIREFDLKKKRFVKNGFELPEEKTDIGWMDENTVLVGTNFGPDSLTTSGYPRIAKIWKRGTPLEKAETLFEGKKEDVSAGAWQSFRPSDRYTVIQRQITFFDSENFILSPNGDKIPIRVPSTTSIGSFFEGYLLIELKETWQPDLKKPPFKTGSLVAIPVADILAQRPYQTLLLYEPDSRSAISQVIVTQSAVFLNLFESVQGKFIRIGKKESTGEVTWKTEEIGTPPNMSISTTDYSNFYDDVYFTAENFLTPTRLVRWDTITGKQTTVKSLQDKFDAQNLVVAQYESTSPDGTKIPYFIVHQKNITLDGNSPTLLYGYGGFEKAMDPYYSATVGKLWLEKGGVYVLANIRGGGEFGPTWHQAAMKENRQKAFDDFISVAEDLIQRKITSPKKLGIMGGSNGGLLVGVAFTQRPELFGAVVCQVPLLDMLRYSKLLAGASWMGEYGNPKDSTMQPILQRYSPYHNIRKDVDYPEVFFNTSTKDDRVHPGHARKMVAALQAMGYPTLYFENTEGGHSGAANLKQRARIAALEYVYLYQKLFD